MKSIILFLSIFDEVWSCSSTTSKNGWNLNEIENQILEIKSDLAASNGRISVLEGELAEANQQIFDLTEVNKFLILQVSEIDNTLTCPAGVEFSVCQCPAGFVYVPHLSQEKGKNCKKIL